MGSVAAQDRVGFGVGDACPQDGVEESASGLCSGFDVFDPVGEVGGELGDVVAGDGVGGDSVCFGAPCDFVVAVAGGPAVVAVEFLLEVLVGEGGLVGVLAELVGDVFEALIGCLSFHARASRL